MQFLRQTRSVGSDGNHTAILSDLDPTKVAVDDAIGNLALKRLPRKEILALVRIFNAIIRLVHFPAHWKFAKVIVIPKVGKSAWFPENHRPISLLPCVSKVFERTFLAALSDQLKCQGTLNDEQFGFRAGHNTTQQILRLTEYITRGFNEHRHTGAVFLDVEKAFDKVWHEGLLYKRPGSGALLFVCQRHSER